MPYKFYNILREKRPEWFDLRIAPDGVELSEKDKKELIPMPMCQFVATRSKDDPQEMYDLLGPDSVRKTAAVQFKNIKSNFKIAIVVDLWLTGFDVPFLDTIYIDKPLTQKHTIIQTVSRVNRSFAGKDSGLVVDFIGIKLGLLTALRTYTDFNEDNFDEDSVQAAIRVVRNQLEVLDAMMHGFNNKKYFEGTPGEKLQCLNEAAEYIQTTKELEQRFMSNVLRLDSGIRMNTYISRNESWTLTQLEERSDHLKNRALSIWKLPETEYRPAEKELDFFTLADDTSLSNRFISKFVYQNTEQPVSSWVEMYLKVLQILYAEDKSILIRLAVSNEEGVAQHFSFKIDGFIRAAEISEGLYVYTNTSTTNKLNMLERLFEMYSVDLSELGFYLRNTERERENENGTRYEIRRKYWSYALPKIKKVNAENGAFSNVDFSKENWINGYIGIAGFNICCVANYDSARVEMVFSKADKSVNKETFDKLKQHKAEVEKALGCKLVWQRGDDKKTSKIFVQLDNVSIAEEGDWYRMANFQADWSKKFFDVLVPYIKN